MRIVLAPLFPHTTHLCARLRTKRPESDRVNPDSREQSSGRSRWLRLLSTENGSLEIGQRREPRHPALSLGSLLACLRRRRRPKREAYLSQRAAPPTSFRNL